MSLNQRFFDSCSQGNVDQFTSLLSGQGSASVNVNYVHNNSTPLTVSITNNHPDIFTGLLNHHDIEVNKKSPESKTALHVACQNNNIGAIEALCAHPLINVNEKTNNGDTPLMLAIIGGHVEAVKKLVAIDQVNLDDLDYRERMNFDDGNIVHSFLTILAIIDEVKQERLRMTLNILRLGNDSDSEDGERLDTEPDGDEVKDDIKSILHRVERVRADILAKMFDYDEKKEHVDSLKRKHEKQTQSLVSKQLKECQALEAKHKYQLRVLQKQQTDERSQAEVDRLATKQELAQLRDSLDHLLECDQATPSPPPAPPCPTCPVCFESLKPPIRILQCINGHLVCERCRSQPQIEVCPTCRKYIVGRATAMEQHLRVLFAHE